MSWVYLIIHEWKRILKKKINGKWSFFIKYDIICFIFIISGTHTTSTLSETYCEIYQKKKKTRSNSKGRFLKGLWSKKKR